MSQCNVQTLLSNAACFECVSPGMWEILELQLLCEILSAGGAGLNLQSQTVNTDNSTVAYSVAHGLSSTPKIVRVVLLCTQNDLSTGYLIGDEISLPDCLENTTTVSKVHPQVFADASHVYALFAEVLIGNEVMFGIERRAGGFFLSPTDFGNFQLKFYYA